MWGTGVALWCFFSDAEIIVVKLWIKRSGRRSLLASAVIDPVVDLTNLLLVVVNLPRFNVYFNLMMQSLGGYVDCAHDS